MSEVAEIIKPVAIESKPFKVNDGLSRLIGIPIISLIMHLVFHTPENESLQLTHLQGIFMSSLFTITYWEGNRLIWCWLQNRLSHYSQTRKRIFYLVLSVLTYGVFATVIIQYIGFFIIGTGCTFPHMVRGYFIGLIPTTLVLMIYEAVYFFHSWKNQVLESEAIMRTQVTSQLDALKNQLDPHFLFNSLNTLSSLIDENEPAQQYLFRLSDVYRYVLVSKDRNTVTLREEMEFVHAFLYLAKVRFTTGLTIEKDIPDSALEQLVAPLSVQLLVENALKHNAITRENPLTVSIQVENGFLWVKNEVKPKVHFESGTKVGLNNILERYRLLTSIPVQILKGSKNFEVGLPLMLG